MAHPSSRRSQREMISTCYWSIEGGLDLAVDPLHSAVSLSIASARSREGRSGGRRRDHFGEKHEFPAHPLARCTIAPDLVDSNDLVPRAGEPVAVWLDDPQTPAVLYLDHLFRLDGITNRHLSSSHGLARASFKPFCHDPSRCDDRSPEVVAEGTLLSGQEAGWHKSMGSFACDRHVVSSEARTDLVSDQPPDVLRKLTILDRQEPCTRPPSFTLALALGARGGRSMLRKVFLGLLVVGFASVPSFAGAHPPAADPQNSCVVKYEHPGTVDVVPVVGTLSYLAPLGTSLPCPGATNWGPTLAEWGSHASPCPALPFVGPVAGAYCGPLVAPGGFATCALVSVVNTVPTGLIIGFDGFVPPGAPGQDGVVNFLSSGEVPVFGPFPPSLMPDPAIGGSTTGHTVPNPYPVSARVIAYPTDIGPYPPGTLAPTDLNLVKCV